MRYAECKCQLAPATGGGSFPLHSIRVPVRAVRCDNQIAGTRICDSRKGEFGAKSLASLRLSLERGARGGRGRCAPAVLCGSGKLDENRKIRAPVTAGVRVDRTSCPRERQTHPRGWCGWLQHPLILPSHGMSSLRGESGRGAASPQRHPGWTGLASGSRC